MPLEPRAHGRHYAGSESQRRPMVWTCVSCNTKQEGRPEGGCVSCGAGADGSLAGQPQPVFDVASLPDTLDSPGGEMTMEEEPVAEPSMRDEDDAVGARSDLIADIGSTHSAGRTQSQPASPTDRLQEAADRRLLAIVRAGVRVEFETLKEQVLLNVPGVYLPEEARFAVSIALRHLAEQQVLYNYEGIPAPDQLLAWADALAPVPEPPDVPAPVATNEEIPQ